MADYIIEKVADGYAVKDRDAGKMVGVVHTSVAQASAAKRELLRRASKRQRPCMCCRTTFWSEGPHNRLCNFCRNGSSADPYAIGARSGRAKVKA